MSCNNAHLLELADAAVVSNYPLLSGVVPLSGMVLLFFKKGMVRYNASYCVYLYK